MSEVDLVVQENASDVGRSMPMLVLIRSAGEPNPDVEQALADALGRFGHASVVSDDEDTVHDVAVTYVVDVAGTRSSRYGRSALHLNAEWSWMGRFEGTICSFSVPLDSMATNQSRGFVDRVGADDVAEAARDLCGAIDRAAAGLVTAGLAPFDQVLDETEALQSNLFKALQDNGELRSEIVAAASSLELAELQIEQLLEEVRRLDVFRDLALATGKGRFVARHLGFLREVIVLAATTVAATVTGVVAGNALSDSPAPTHSPVVEELVVKCGELSIQWSREL